MTVSGLAAAARLRELLTKDELAVLDTGTGRTGQLGPVTPGLREVSLMALLRYRVVVLRNGQLAAQPEIDQVDWTGLRARATSTSQAAWQARLRETAELQSQLLVIFEACTNLTRPAPRTRRDTFLLGHLWSRPLHTLYRAAGSDLPRYEAVIREAVEKEAALGTHIEAPQDIRATALELAADVDPVPGDK